jgi:hypothetical protein
MAAENALTERPVEWTPFVIKDCVLIAIATGKRALTLRELLGFLSEIEMDSIYHHVWGGLLQPRFEEREYPNDFAAWAWHGLHDGVLAERLSTVDPTAFEDLESLRREFVDIIEQRLDESEYLHWVRATQSFELLRSQIVVFGTHLFADSPYTLAEVVPKLSTGSIFYHFIDARRRLSSGEDDFRAYLNQFGQQYVALCETLASIDPYFGSLHETRQALAEAFGAYLHGAG